MLTSNPSIEASLRLLHRWFLFKPEQDFINQVQQTRWTDEWPYQTAAIVTVLTQTDASLRDDAFAVLERDYYRLFLGPGRALAYPWGSVYTDKDNLLFGATSTRFQHFCQQRGIELTLVGNQPWDHIGVQLAVLAELLQQGQSQAAAELLGEHLLPWAPTFFSLVKHHGGTDFYRGVAELAELTLAQIAEQGQVTVQPLPIHCPQIG
ncbi:molecular chaperone TorD family protein [uncultured Ferrimonas sp.]|uniref:TorD/DmsD family molecular chaperone n=1 Tax=uncultured Ferrimonas sp. TaxID=432640 RepID=UPI002637777F|nr:molecular chaperone TorD family protein [uncultured Ferrimonas sp.]